MTLTRFGIGLAAAATAMSALALTTGCQIVGAMAASHHRQSSHEVKAKYRGLADKTFAVVVSADRSIQADHPDIVVTLTRGIARRLAEETGASGYVPANEVLAFQYQRPNWVAMTPLQLAEEFGVQRLVFVDLAEYRLTDPGNPYVWKGVAIGTVSVTEADGSMPSIFTFRESIRVGYPDLEGVSPLEQPRDTVKIALTNRFEQRAAWLFFDHMEKNTIEY